MSTRSSVEDIVFKFPVTDTLSWSLTAKHLIPTVATPAFRGETFPSVLAENETGLVNQSETSTNQQQRPMQRAWQYINITRSQSHFRPIHKYVSIIVDPKVSGAGLICLTHQHYHRRVVKLLKTRLRQWIDGYGLEKVERLSYCTTQLYKTVPSQERAT